MNSGLKIVKGYLCYSCIILCIVTAQSLSTSSIESRIINGTEVTWNNTRYQVSIRLETIDRYFYGSGHMCGGSLISNYIVLTATHCVWNDNLDQFRSPSEFSIVMGNLDRFSQANTLKFGVSQIILSSNFDSTTFRDDIAIMIMDKYVPETYTGSSIIELNGNLNMPVGTECIVTGWGLNEKKRYPQKLMSVEVPIIDKRECSTNYGSQSIMAGMLCAGYMGGERDACAGDSGGPLVCDNKLVGIVSYGIGCGLPGYPGVYTDVAYYTKWIRKLTGLTKKYVESLSQQMGGKNASMPVMTTFMNYTILSNSFNSTNSTQSNNSTTNVKNKASSSLDLSMFAVMLIVIWSIIQAKF